MAFGLEESTDLSDAEITERVDEAADILGITDLLDRKPGELSGGQQQRVAPGGPSSATRRCSCSTSRWRT